MHISPHTRPLLVSSALSGASLVTRPPLVRALAMPSLRRYTRDNMVTLDQATIDSAGSFFISELERLDPTMHDPLVSITYGRDIQLREDVQLSDELSSFTLNSYAAPGGINPGGKAWIGKDTNAIAAIALDIGKVANPLMLWAMEMSYTIPELASAARLGRPIDEAKYKGIKLKNQMDIDEMVYIGDSMLGYPGLANNDASIYHTNVVNGAGGQAAWATKTPDEILADINAAIVGAWSASAWAVAPTDIRLPPLKFSYLVNNKVSGQGNLSIMSYIMENNISMQQSGQKLNIQALKWLTGRGVGNTDRMLVYTNEKDYVRYPMTPLQRTQPEFRSIFQMTTYYCRLGVVEFVYPETVAYLDGI